MAGAGSFEPAAGGTDFNRGRCSTIRIDNGTEFTSKAREEAYRSRVKLDFTRAGKAADNEIIESVGRHHKLLRWGVKTRPHFQCGARQPPSQQQPQHGPAGAKCPASKDIGGPMDAQRHPTRTDQ